MLGPGAQKRLPKTASLEDKESWLSGKPIDSIHFNVDLETSPSNAQENNPHSQGDGPGHPESIFQQLPVICQMMTSVGVRSFRPDYSQSMSSSENKWLWDLALKIFIKLVECGEYTSIPITSNGKSTIRDSFTSHSQTLRKRYVSGVQTSHSFSLLIVQSDHRYREENRDVSRKQKGSGQSQTGNQDETCESGKFRIRNFVN